MRHLLVVALSILFLGSTPAFPAPAVSSDMVQTGTDIAAKWQAPRPGFDYDKRALLIPMRDGIKLLTILYVPKGAKGLPILLERTPYNAGSFGEDKPHMRDVFRRANGSMMAISLPIRIFAANTARRAPL